MIANDTIRLVVEFKDFNGRTINPDNVTLKIYDKKKNLIEEITENIKQDGTKYYYDYTTTDSDFIFEFSGFYNDKIVLSRQLVKVQFNK